jgi:hypothetical protein
VLRKNDSLRSGASRYVPLTGGRRRLVAPYTVRMSIVNGIVSRPRGRRLPPAMLWITCFAIVPLASFGTVCLMIRLKHGQPIAVPWAQLYHLAEWFFAFLASPLIGGALAWRQSLGWVGVVLVALGAFVALFAWIWVIYSVLSLAGVPIYPNPD